MTININPRTEQKVRDMVALWWANEWHSLGDAAKHFNTSLATVRKWARYAEYRGWMTKTMRGDAVVSWHITPKGVREV